MEIKSVLLERFKNRYRKKVKTLSYLEIEDLIDLICEEIGGYSVEGIENDAFSNEYWVHIVGLYINVGDTYDKTIVFNTVMNRLEVTTVGDYVPYIERKLRHKCK